ncbi:Uncharacterised protein (plasmid) [Legionella adelaidensis]|uniref:Uncharacterized protein n=1 Tax=Legionella adelaidensis TaxID=45056 RepID=A0A448N9L3_9GAMM|nr:Uncharacterised protein [Legionella adelaidensis]
MLFLNYGFLRLKNQKRFSVEPAITRLFCILGPLRDSNELSIQTT